MVCALSFGFPLFRYGCLARLRAERRGFPFVSHNFYWTWVLGGWQVGGEDGLRGGLGLSSDGEAKTFVRWESSSASLSFSSLSASNPPLSLANYNTNPLDFSIPPTPSATMVSLDPCTSHPEVFPLPAHLASITRTTANVSIWKSYIKLCLFPCWNPLMVSHWT